MMAKLALITGSTRGIGLSVAKVPFRVSDNSELIFLITNNVTQMLAGKGHDILLNGFGEPEEIGSVMDTCKQLGARKVDHHGADLCDLKQIKSMFDFVTHKFGHTPDILVNNAGMFHSPQTESGNNIVFRRLHFKSKSINYKQYYELYRWAVCISD